MSNKTTLGFLLTAVAAVTTGCPDDTPAPRPDVVDVPDSDVVTDTPDADVPSDISDVPVPVCGDTRFIRPMADAVLGIADDADGNCSNGFTSSVQVATNALQGSMLELRVNGRTAATATVAGSTVTFNNVMFDSGGTQSLEIYQGMLPMACATINVAVNCNLPRCQITAPSRSSLNGADNAMPAMPFAIDFTVGTDIEDGRDVLLFVSNSTQQLRAPVMGGTATFRNVPLAPDGTYRARATCTNRAGNAGMSAEATFTVDSAAPSLEVTRPMAGSTLGVSTDANAMVDGVQFRVCGRSDAMGQDFCATVAGGMDTCAPVAGAMTDACVELTCPTGGAPFNVDASVRDAAGNVTRTNVMNVRCQSTLPSVRVVAPAAYDPARAVTVKNAARDADPVRPGAQIDVVACTDRSAGTASLYLNGDTTPVGAAVPVAATAMGDPCATLGMGFVGIARFPRVNVTQTAPAPSRPTDEVPANPTIEVSVTDADDTGRSTATRLYVDTATPVPSLVTCTDIVTPGSDGFGVADIDVTSDSYPVTLTLSRTGSMPTTLTLTAPSLPAGRGRFLGVRLAPGITNLSVAATDPAGNAGVSTSACSREVGNPPTLSFTAPIAGQVFRTATTSITLRSDAPAGTLVSLTVGSAAAITAPVSATGTVTFTGVRLPEGDVVTLAAETASVVGRGVGRATLSVVVDSQAPTAPAMFTAVIPSSPASARRAGTIRLSWTDGADPSPTGGQRAVSRYDVRTAIVPLSDVNFDSATPLTTTITPGAPGAANQTNVPGLRLEQPHYFAMRAIDRSGNPSGSAVYFGPVNIPLIRDTIADPAVALGNEVSGGFDVNGDGFADVVVGSGITTAGWGGIARIYFGSATGISATNYTQFNGSAVSRFGSSAVSLGDINGDGLGDVAFGEPGPTSASALAAGSVYVFFGRRTWNSRLSPYASTDANVTIGGGTGEFATASLGFALARVGDFNGDGLADIAASAPQAQPSRGAVAVIFGRATFPATLSINAANVLIRNTTTETLFGRYLAGGGRVVGNDTREDLLVGYGSVAGTGFVSVFGGRAAATPVSLTLADAALNRTGTVTSPANNGQYSCGGVGDINGDGRADLAIGTTGSGPGQVSLFFGDPGGGLTAGPVITSNTVVTSDTFGTRMASVYDPAALRPSLLSPSPVGADLLAGAAGYMGSDPRVYVFTGRASWSGLTILNANHVVGLGGAVSQPLTAAAWVGDVDGDGYVDAALGRASGAGTMIVLR
jgi:hypothetical protein